MASPPPAAAEAAILGPASELVRRIEIYESNGTTRWSNGDYDDRLIGGSVTVDYSRDERRSFDIELDNSDFAIEHRPDGFWYDKIVKVFCGVHFIDTTPTISYLVRTNLVTNPSAGTNTTGWAYNAIGGTATVARITSSGSPYGDTAAEMTWTAPATGTGGGIYWRSAAGVVTPGNTYSFRMAARCSRTQGLALLAIWYDSGGAQINSGQVFFDQKVVPAGTWVDFSTNGLVAPAGATSVLIGAYGNGAGATVWAAGDKLAMNGALIENAATVGPYFDGATLNFANRAYTWTGTAQASTSKETITVSTPTAVPSTWETQVGEFMIDSISEDHFPYTVKVTGRDYTKKCLVSKFTQATGFAKGSKIEDVIKTLALNSGCTKFILPLTGKTLGTDYFFERGTERWKAMKEISDSFGYELFFDAQGYLVMREYQDPVSAPLAYTLETGTFGNLVSYSKAVNDTRLYNHIVVTGENSDSAVPVVFAEALNTEPSSPTRIDRLGDRVYQYSSAFITTTAQAQDVANKFLKIHGLEEFDLNFASIALPWLEVGTIIEFLDPRGYVGQPTRFLLSSLTLPLDLGAMSGNAKRVSVVG